jgi:hypothetical protein
VNPPVPTPPRKLDCRRRLQTPSPPPPIFLIRMPPLSSQGTLLRQEASESAPRYAAEEARLQAEVASAVSQALRERPQDAVARVAELLSAKGK